MRSPRNEDEDRFRVLFEHSPDAIFIESSDGVVLDANAAAGRLHGIPRERLIGMTISDLVPASDREKVLRDFPGWFSGSLARHEGAALRADGAEVPVEITGTPLLHDGRPAVLLHVRDVSARKAAEAHLIEREWQLGYALDQGDAVVFRRSFHEDRFEYLGPGVERLCGYRAEELTPSRWDGLVEYCEFAGDLGGLPQGEPKRRFMSGKVSRWLSRVRIRRKQGDVRWVMDMSTLTRDDEGRTLGAVGVLLDVTDFKRAEEQLLSGDTRMRMIAEQLPIVLWCVDRDLRFTMSEGAGLRLLGLKPAQVVGMSLSEFTGSDDPAHLVIASHRRALAGKPASYEYRFGDRWYFTHVEPLRDAAGAITGAAGVAQDLTDFRRIEEQLRNTEHLDSLGVLAGGIAHEFNNLLVGIIGNADLAEAELPGDSRAVPALDRIRQAGNRAKELCTLMLAFAGQEPVTRSSVDLRRIAVETVTLARAGLGRNVTFTIEPDPGIAPLAGDDAQIRQVAMSLVVNASEAIGDKPGRVALATGRETIPAGLTTTTPPLQPGDYAFLRVRDSGGGMSAETMERMFEPFFSTKHAGRGLGLSAALGILRRHGGGFAASSAPGEGSVFTAYLPIAGPRAAQHAPPPGTGGAGAILIVDDEQTVREVTAQMLKRGGRAAITAASGEEAVALLSADNAPDLDVIMLDVNMPGLGGEETLRRIRSRFPDLPAILMSGFDDADLVERTRSLAPVVFLPKPFGRATLLAKIAEASAL